MKHVLAVAALLAMTVPASAAEIYRWIDGSTVVYSDQPPHEGTAVTAMPGREPLPVATADDATATPRSTLIAPVPTAPATVEEILDLSGVRAQLPGIAASLGAEYLPRPDQLEGRDSARVARIVAKHFAAERFYVAIQHDFRQIDAQQLDALAAWFRSPLGRRITALEIAASRPDAEPAIAAFTAKLKTAPPNATRLELVQRLDWVSGTSDDTADLALAIARSVARAGATSTPAERRARPGLVERRVEEMRAQIAGAMGESVRVQMLYAYGPLSDEELKAYVDFLASGHGRAYSRISHAALLRAVREAADRTAVEIARAVPSHGWAAAQRVSGSSAR
jgi:Domain of unknown function (DUF4124)/Uncharacterized protein conserved in bacteria (DUF2059)